jgi:hypothetical protein
MSGIEITANPEWSRIPDKGKTLEGIYRSNIFALIKANKIESVAISDITKASGSKRVGMRLVNIPSLRAWIASNRVPKKETK